MDTDDLGWLLACAAAGSLSAAAKGRGVAVSTVARRLDAIEARLRLKLIDRRRDGVRLTADGERIAGFGRRVIAEIDALERAATALRTGDPRRIVVSATESVIADILAPGLPRLAARNPGIAVNLRSQGSVVSLAGREADIAIRMSPPVGDSLIGKKLPPIRLALFTSVAYLAGRDPATLRLSEERLLAYDDSYGRIPELDTLTVAGLGDKLHVTTNSTRALVAATHAGVGIALLPAHLAIPIGLVEVAGPAFTPRTPFLVTHRDLQRQPDIRIVHRWIVEAFAIVLAGRLPRAQSLA